MSRLSLLVICVLLFVPYCKGAISDKRLCGDPTCSDPVSYAKTLIRYASDDARILSFQGNVKVTVFSKSAGKRPDLWGVEIDGKRGYAPKDFIREHQVIKGKLQHIVSTRDDFANTLDGQDSQANGGLEEPPPDNELKLPPFPNIGVAAEQMKDDIPSSSETLEPYEVADGTTIYYSTDAPAEPMLIQATTTDSNVQPTMQSQLDPDSKNSDVDKPNPSMVLPQSTTSSDVNTEINEHEGSATEKIYKYLISNFMSDQGSGELMKEEEMPTQNMDAETKGDEPDESGQKVFIESTESVSVPISINAAMQPPGSVIESDGNTKHKVSPSPASIDPSKKPTLFESGEEDDDEEDDAEDDEEDEEYADSDEETLTYSGDSSPDSTIPSPGSDDRHGGSLPSTETKEFKREISDDNKSENQDPNVDNLPSSIEIGVKSSEPNANVVSEIMHGSTANTLKDGNTQSESDTKVFGSLEQISDHLEQTFNASHAEVVGNEINETQTDGNANVGNTNTVEPVDDNPSNKVPESHDLGDGSNIEAVGQTTTQFNAGPNSDATPSPLSANKTPEMLSETIVNPHPDMTSSAEKSVDDLGEKERVLPEKDSLNIIPEIDQETDKPSADETLDSHALPIDSENGEIESSVDQNGLNDTNISESVDTSTVKPETENMLEDIPQSNVLEMAKNDVTSDFYEDESTLITSSKPTTEDSTETSYVDVLNEDSPLNVVTDMPAIETIDSSEAVADDISESSGGFLSNIFGSLFGSPSTPEDTENSVEVVEENAKSEADDGARNSAWSSVWSYTRQPDSMPANNQPETSSGCLADSGTDPDCDKVLLPGNVPRVDSDNGATIQQVMSEQDPNIPHMETWQDGGSSGMLSYLGITAISMVVIILGHWFIEKMRCDSSYIKKINDLERALLYAELESKNLKIDLEERPDKTMGIEESEKIALLEEQLLTLLDTSASLEEKNAGLEEKNNGLQMSLDVATEAGLELNRMLSDLLSTNKGSESLIGSVNDLQQQLNSQQATISNMKIVLKTKETESESLRNNLTLSQGTIKSLEQELNQLTETLNELLVEKAAQENQFKCIKDELDAKLKSKSENEDKLAKEIDVLHYNVTKMESEVCTRDIEMALLRECITQLKKDSSSENEDFKQLFNVAKAETASQRLLEERDRLSDELQGEKDARKLLEGHVGVITKEVDLLRKAVEQSEKEKVEAVTKHAVLADYFKDKESQLHKELGYRDALYMQTKGDATMTHEEVKSLHEQLDNYKSQIDTLKKEVVDQERGLKSQVLAFEKKSHENWLVARQAERKLQEVKVEAGLLRNRLTIVEKNASNTIQNDKAPTNKTSDREMLDAKIGSRTTPPLYPLDMNVQLGDPNAPAFATRVQPVANSGPPHGPLSPINHLADENMFRRWPSIDSPAPNSRSQPAPRSLPPRISPANTLDITFTREEALNPLSPFFGILNPSAPYDPFHGRPIRDRQNPDLYHIMPLVPYAAGPAPVMLPPPLLPNLPASHDRRPPPLGRMSSPPVGGRISPPPPRGPVRARLSSPLERTPPPNRRMSPPDRRHRRSAPHRYASPERTHRRSSPLRGPRPRGATSPSRSLERERRRSVGSTGRVSPFEQTPSQERGRRGSLTPRGPFDHSVTNERISSPEHGRSYRRRSPSPSVRYSDSSPDSAPESRRYARRYDYSPESSYRGRSRTPSPTGFRPISREASNNQGSNRSSNQSFESDESNRRGGRL